MRSLAEAAVARGVDPADVVKTMVVRRGEGDFVFVLVPGDRVISWPKLRALLGVNRCRCPTPTRHLATSPAYPEGHRFTPFGAKTALPVIADELLAGRAITLGAGVNNTAIAVDADAGHWQRWAAGHRRTDERPITWSVVASSASS